MLPMPIVAVIRLLFSGDALEGVVAWRVSGELPYLLVFPILTV